jgi:hypothetical protein
MNRRHILLTILLLASFAFAFCEDTEQASSWSRMINQFGFGSTVGDPLSSNDPGFTITMRNYFFFNPKVPDGAYFGVLGGSLIHSVGSTEIGDTRWATLGYRSVVGPRWLSLDASLSFVQGSRTTGSTVKGGYLGLGPAVGAYIACSTNLDIGISVEPVFSIINLKSNDTAKPKSYVDIVFFVCMKDLFRNERHAWSETVKSTSPQKAEASPLKE